MPVRLADAVPPTALPIPGPDSPSLRSASDRRIDWVNTLFLIAAHALAAGTIVYMAAFRFSWWTLMVGGIWMVLCGLSITGGYHRLFAHPTYKCGPMLRLFYLLFGAASVQNSALRWASDHRRHHAQTDRDEDPYNIRRGFWWAHIGWVLFRSGRRDFANVPDLVADPLMRFQDRFYVPLAIAVGAAVPAALGMIWGDPIGALLTAGFLRLVLQYHATFSVNSVAHTIGRQPYSRATSARDSLITAIVTLGEGYHNFHHRFPFDYRNGIRAWHLDPTKWWVWSASRLGLTWDLKRASRRSIAEAREQTAAQSREPALVAA